MIVTVSNRKLLSFVLGASYVFVEISGTSLAYETDLHYGLTYWLSVQAGFSSWRPHEIARGNEGTDNGYLDAKHAVVWSICIRGDPSASELVRELHFRSQEPVPNRPEKRPVESSRPFASSDVLSRIEERGTDERDRLQRFGKALHGLQDTYSHSGEASRLSLCSDDLVWSHPGSRGGPYRHDADLTYLDRDSCLNVAVTTYTNLGKMMDSLAGSIRDKPSWERLEGDAKEFCKASTKKQKETWLRDHHVPQAASIVKNINLVDGTDKGYRDVPDLNLRPVQAVSELESTHSRNEAQGYRDSDLDRRLDRVYTTLTTPPGATEWFGGFLQQWLTADPNRLELVVKEYFDKEVHLRGNRLAKSSDEIARTLLQWRLADRGKVREGLLEWDTLTRSSGALLTSAGDSWRALLVSRRGSDHPFLLGSTPNDRLAAIVVFRHAPYDVLLFDVDGREGTYRIRRFESIVFH